MTIPDQEEKQCTYGVGFPCCWHEIEGQNLRVFGVSGFISREVCCWCGTRREKAHGRYHLQGGK